MSFYRSEGSNPFGFEFLFRLDGPSCFSALDPWLIIALDAI